MESRKRRSRSDSPDSAGGADDVVAPLLPVVTEGGGDGDVLVAEGGADGDVLVAAGGADGDVLVAEGGADVLVAEGGADGDVLVAEGGGNGVALVAEGGADGDALVAEGGVNGVALVAEGGVSNGDALVAEGGVDGDALVAEVEAYDVALAAGYADDDDDDGPPEEISYEETMWEMMIQERRLELSVPNNPWNPCPSVDEYDSWNSGNRERYFFWLRYERGYRQLTQFESTFFTSYSYRKPQGFHKRYSQDDD